MGIALGVLAGPPDEGTNAPARTPAVILPALPADPPSGADEPPLLLSDEPPLLLSDDEPLLLLDEGPGVPQPGVTWADNSRCQVCHINFMHEALTLSHARTNIGCATCHGPSDEHIADESWASGGNGTPPDIMFPWRTIGRACIACHKIEQVLAAEKHKPDILAIWLQDKVCTDCHGQHRMAIRRCKWK